MGNSASLVHIVLRTTGQTSTWENEYTYFLRQEISSMGLFHFSAAILDFNETAIVNCVPTETGELIKVEQ